MKLINNRSEGQKMSDEAKAQPAIQKFDMILIVLLCEVIRSNPNQFYENGKPIWSALEKEFDRTRSELQESLRSTRPPMPGGKTLYGR